MEELGESQDDREFDKLRGLKGDGAELDPTLGTRGDDPIPKHGQQAEDGHGVNSIRKVRVEAILNERNNHHHGQADEHPIELLEIEGSPRSLTVGCHAVEIKETDAGKKKDHPYQGPVEVSENTPIDHHDTHPETKTKNQR
jgi:hypothetical protein